MSIERNSETEAVSHIDLLRDLLPITVNNCPEARKRVIEAGIVNTHKMAQEVIINPIIASQSV